MHGHDWGKRKALSPGCLELDGYPVYDIDTFFFFCAFLFQSFKSICSYLWICVTLHSLFFSPCYSWYNFQPFTNGLWIDEEAILFTNPVSTGSWRTTEVIVNKQQQLGNCNCASHVRLFLYSTINKKHSSDLGIKQKYLPKIFWTR